MPQALLIPLITTIAGAGVSFGLEKLAGPSGPSSSDLQAQSEAQAKADAEKQQKQEAAMRQQLLRRTMPDTQAAVGGSLTEAPFAQLTTDIAGVPGNLQDALKLIGRGNEDTSGLSFSGGS